MALLRHTVEPRHVLLPPIESPSCALLVDPGEPGVNLFGLSCPARLVSLDDRVCQHEAGALVRAARALAYRTGFDEFVVFQEFGSRALSGSAEGCLPPEPVPGFCFTVARPAFAAWRAHIADMFADRLGPLRAVLPEAS